MHRHSVFKAFSLPNIELPDGPPLRPLLEGEGTSLQLWEEALQPEVKERWLSLLGRPAFDDAGFERSVQKMEEWDGPEFRAVRYLQATGPGHFQKVIVLYPKQPTDPAQGPLPCAVVPFYQPETVAGLAPASEKEGLRASDDLTLAGEVRQMGRHLARLGFVVACVEAFPFNTVPEPSAKDGEGGEPMDWWQVAAEEIARRHPGWTGLGKLVHDTSLALDLLLEQPGVDPTRVLMMGHSLGGKMAFYTGALDARVSCVIASDFGLPWRSTNWQKPWYLGPKVPADDCGMAHHELLALLAPRPFFLIAGETDNSQAWHYFQAARPVYDLYGAGDRLGCIDHASGHSPTVASLDVAYAWMGEAFALPHRRWRSGG